jgi:hypothetical protein
MDVIRNVGVREICDDINLQKENAERNSLFIFKSMPNILLREYSEFIINKSREDECVYYQGKPINNMYLNKISPEPGDEQQEECAISGRLEIRVLPKEDPIYFDAVVNEGFKIEPTTPENEDKFDDELNIKLSKKEKDKEKKKYDIKIYEDSLKIKKYKVVTRDTAEESVDHSSENSGFHQHQEIIYEQKNKDKDKDKLPVPIEEEPVADADANKQEAEAPKETLEENVEKVEEKSPNDVLKKNVDLGKKIEKEEEEGKFYFLKCYPYLNYPKIEDEDESSGEKNEKVIPKNIASDKILIVTYETSGYVVPDLANNNQISVSETKKDESYININESLSQKLSWIGDDNQLSTDNPVNPASKCTTYLFY